MIKAILQFRIQSLQKDSEKYTNLIKTFAMQQNSSGIHRFVKLREQTDKKIEELKKKLKDLENE